MTKNELIEDATGSIMREALTEMRQTNLDN